MNQTKESDHFHDLLSVIHDEELYRLEVRLKKKGLTILAGIIRNEIKKREHAERHQ